MAVEPLGDFENRYDCGVTTICNRGGIGDVVKVSVRNQNVADLIEVVSLRGGGWMRGQERIEKNAMPADFDQPAAM